MNKNLKQRSFKTVDKKKSLEFGLTLQILMYWGYCIKELILRKLQDVVACAQASPISFE